MGDYEHRTTVTTDPEALFDYLSDVQNLPHYFAAMKSAERAEGSAVRTAAVVDGQLVEGEAWFTADGEARSIRWGSQGPNNYSGELTVTGSDGGAEVVVRLHTEHVDGPSIDDGLLHTLAQIKQNVENDADDAAPGAG
ncbi:MAG: SRPBCC family protein [Pseudonocardia sp.]|nr:SRPBCC family protein [Pseudonocardia sp.]